MEHKLVNAWPLSTSGWVQSIDSTDHRCEDVRIAFSAFVPEQVGWDVHALRSPMDGRVFYVGRGEGNRVFAHAKDAQVSDEGVTVSQKVGLINDSHAQELDVETIIVRRSSPPVSHTLPTDPSGVTLTEVSAHRLPK